MFRSIHTWGIWLFVYLPALADSDEDDDGIDDDYEDEHEREVDIEYSPSEVKISSSYEYNEMENEFEVYMKTSAEGLEFELEFEEEFDDDETEIEFEVEISEIVEYRDLDADGIAEFITYDDSFAYQYCPYAAGVGVKVILAYDPEQGLYIPASPRFPEQYAEEIATNQQRALAAPGDLGEWEGTNICAILPLALDYLYMGESDKAQAEFFSRYSGIDIDLKWNEILQVVQSSPLYIP